VVVTGLRIIPRDGEGLNKFEFWLFIILEFCNAVVEDWLKLFVVVRLV
jgi:hypothetical protein